MAPGSGISTAPGSPQVRPGTGTSTSPMAPGMGTTPMAPGSGMGTIYSPYIYGTTPEESSPFPQTVPGTPSTYPTTPLTVPSPGTMEQGTTTPGTAPGRMTSPRGMAPSGNMPPNYNIQPNMPNITPGTQPLGYQTMPYYYNPSMYYQSNEMLNMNYPAYQGMPNMYLPNANTYTAPMGIPLFPLYGYDNSIDLDRDVEYMKQLYPGTVKTIQNEIDDECDHMEYDGSVMFDEYPDKVYLDSIVDRIYEKVKNRAEKPATEVEINSLYFYPPRRNQDYLRDLVTLILLSEIFNRRRRYRSRKRWF